VADIKALPLEPAEQAQEQVMGSLFSRQLFQIAGTGDRQDFASILKYRETP
jgi:hypothetical protein